MSRIESTRKTGEQFLIHSQSEAEPIEIVEVRTPPRPRRRRIGRIAIWLAIFTFLSTFWAGATNFAPTAALVDATAATSLLYLRAVLLANWFHGLQFSLALMAILTAHEFGHYLLTIYYRVPSTPPLFIPFPVSSLGTCGAVIAMQGGEADRRQIFDIGLAGPIAGLCVAIPILMYAIGHPSKPDFDAYESMAFGQPLLVQWLAEWLAPNKASEYMSMVNSQSSPLLMAGWAGLLVTGLNMMPIGQLDGGHVSFGLFGTRSTYVGLVTMALTGTYLLAFGMLTGQMHIFTIMYLLALLMGPRHPPSRDDNRQLGWPRQIIGVLSLSIPILCIPANPIVLV